MKISKKEIDELIFEEIKNAKALLKKLDRTKTDETLNKFKLDLIGIFKKYLKKISDSSFSSKKNNIKLLKNELKDLKNQFKLLLDEYDVNNKNFLSFCITQLKDSADPQMVSVIVNALQSDELRHDKLDDFTSSITPEQEKFKEATPGDVFRSKKVKSPEAYEGDDVRKYRKQ